MDSGERPPLPAPEPPEAFDPGGADPDPMARFQRWWSQARGLTASPDAADSMTLATATPNADPSARMVILRGFDRRGFVFFTSYQSPKARDLIENPQAALVFNWEDLQRQVRVTGPAERLPREESEAYFRQRPPGHRLAAWASPQSEPIADRRALERMFEETEARFPGDEIPLPEFWGGFRIVPESIEFWQGRENRLHDRVRYTLAGDGWRIERLAP